MTNGTGNVGISTAHRTITNNYFNSSLFPAGFYQLMVYAHDTHGNADTVYVPFEISSQDVIAPAPPVLKSVLNDSANRVTISWYPNTEPDLKGYNLYFSNNNGLLWQKYNVAIPPTSAKLSITSAGTFPVYFKLTAYDSAAITNESIPSDIYGLHPNIGGKKTLIVDAFDRISGSYKLPTHPFAMTAGQSLFARFETAHNQSVVDGSVPLTGYDAVVWLFGDEGNTDETFGAQEQAKAIAYLNAGGKIFASGSEIAYDLDRDSGPSVEDRDFLHTYFKASYAGDDAGKYFVIGSPAGFLNGVSFAFGDTTLGSSYDENYPDYLFAMTGVSYPAASYDGGGAAAIADQSGKTLLLGIPFETIHAKADRDAVMTRVLGFFGIPTFVIERSDGTVPDKFSLEQNYPNPFNPSTTIGFTIQESGMTSLRIYDLLGKEIALLVNEELSPGSYKAQWDARGVASGIYFYRLSTKYFSATKKLVLMK